MRYGVGREKNLNYSDSEFHTNQNTFQFSELPVDRIEKDEMNKKYGNIFTNFGKTDRQFNKRFVKEFKKWISRHERIGRGVEFDFTNSEGKQFISDDKMRLISRMIITLLDYQNKINLNPLLKCIDFVCENYLNNVDKRVLISHTLSKFDFKDEDTTERFTKIYNSLGALKDNNPFEYGERLKLLQSIFNSDSFELSHKISDEDIKRINDNEVVIVYRAFIVPYQPSDTDIRMTRRMTDEQLEMCAKENNMDKGQLKYIQLQGRGISYTFCKKTAFTLGCWIDQRLSNYFNKNENKSRLAIGQYIIPTKNIASYTNDRSEREVIITRPTCLWKYEFVNKNAELDKDDFCPIVNNVQKVNCPVSYSNTSESAMHNLLPEMKIHRIFNNSEKLENEINTKMRRT